MSTTKKSEEKTNDEKSFSTSRLYRSETNKVIAGVSGGLGEFFNIDPTIIRLLFILLTIFGGSGLLIYIVLWIIVPSESSLKESSDLNFKKNFEEMKSRANSFTHDIKINKGQENSRFTWALIIILLGFLILMHNYGILEPLELDRLWPLILIILGLTLIFKK